MDTHSVEKISLKSRLKQIEGALTPKQAVAAWLEGAHRFESDDDYTAWMIDRPSIIVQQARPLALLGTLANETTLAALPVVVVSPKNLGRLATYQAYFRGYALEVFNLKAAIEYVEKEYFDGICLESCR